MSVLIVQAEGQPTSGEKSPSFYLATALGVNSSPPFKVDVVPVSRVNAGTLERRSAVVLNDAGPIPAQTDPLLKRFVEQGGGMFVALGEQHAVGRRRSAAAHRAGSAGRSSGAAGSRPSAGSTTATRSSRSTRIRGTAASARRAIRGIARSRRRPPTRCSRSSTTAPSPWSSARSGSGRVIDVHAIRSTTPGATSRPTACIPSSYRTRSSTWRSSSSPTRGTSWDAAWTSRSRWRRSSAKARRAPRRATPAPRARRPGS